MRRGFWKHCLFKTFSSISSRPESNSRTIDTTNTSIIESIQNVSLSSSVVPEMDNNTESTIYEAYLSPFFQLPFEIRSEIFYYMICVRAMEPSGPKALPDLSKEDIIKRASFVFCNGDAQLCPQYQGGVREGQPTQRQPWGRRPMAKLFPVCRQWHREIQIAFYSLFSFAIDLQGPISQWKPHSLSFLPKEAPLLLRSLHLFMWDNWIRIVLEHREEYFIQLFQEIATLLPGLTKITLSFRYLPIAYTAALWTPEVQAGICELILAMVRPFRHIPDFNIAVWGEGCWTERPSPSMQCYNLFLDIAKKHGGRNGKGDIRHYYFL